MAENSNRLPVLAENIRKAHADMQEAAKTAAEKAIEAGHALIEAKGLLQHGEWQPWLREHCALSERTARLYMQIARSGHKPATVAVLGLQGAAQSLTLAYCWNQPLHDGDDATRREWFLFALYLAACCGFRAANAELHIDWLGRKDFKTPEEWLGPEGQRFARACGMTVNTGHLEAFQAFKAKYHNYQISDLEVELSGIAANEPDEPIERVRRRRRRA